MELRDQLQATLGDAFALERELGGGGMSRVFLAEDRALGRKIVVKVLSSELAAGVSAERFAREIRVAARLQQANIVPLLTAGETLGLPYYTMPFVEGQSLREHLAGSGPLGIAGAVNILRDVARALAYAHEHGVIHRDIKPENVLLSGDAAVVTDFGIAKAITAARNDLATGTLTSAGVGLGTPAYVAPEQALGDPTADHRADVYSFGCLAFELLAGHAPFCDRTPQQLLAAHVHEEPPNIGEVRSEAPATLASVVMRCLSKDPAARPQSAREILGLLDTVATPLPTHGPSRHMRPTLRIAAVAGVGLIVLAIVLIARARHGTGPTEPHTLAVMPFTNVGGDSSQTYFADGIAIDLTNALTKVPGLRVASRSLAFMYKGKATDVRTLGKELHVDAVLEGTVQRSNGRLRVTTQLTRTADGFSLWSNDYDRDTKDLFGVQDTIAREIVGELRLSLGGQSAGAANRPRVAGTTNFDAYDSYLHGVYLLDHRGPGVAKSIDYFRDAIAKDSGLARAYGKLSEALELMPYFSATSASSVEAQAVTAANRALKLDSTIAEAHIGLALAHEHEFRWREGATEYTQAIRLEPTSATAHLHYGRHLMHLGNIPDAALEFRRATELDPVSGTAFVWLAHMLSLSGQHDSALIVGRRARELDPGLLLARTIGAIDAVSAGRPEVARPLVSGIEASPPWRGQAAYSLGMVGDTGALRTTIRELERLPPETWLLHTGLMYAHLGARDTARALSELEAALRAREIAPNWNPFSDRMFDLIRHSSRFAAVVRGYRLDVGTMTSLHGGRPAP